MSSGVTMQNWQNRHFRVALQEIRVVFRPIVLGPLRARVAKEAIVQSQRAVGRQ